jgi:hypothetical protein
LPAFSPSPLPKTTLPLAIDEAVPVALTWVQPGKYFFDFGSELMAGLSLTVDGVRTESNDHCRNNSPLLCAQGASGTTMLVALGEELVDATTVLAPMRTGNDFRFNW